ncbi:MAG: DUF3299 domain-containing protein [Pseudomonadota bacterium]
MKRKILLTAGFIVCIFIGIQLGKTVKLIVPKVQDYLASLDAVYTTQDIDFIFEITSDQPYDLTWEELLPLKERQVLSEYQQSEPTTVDEFTSILVKSLEAAYDEDYKAAAISTNTNADIDGRVVSIPGFIVPLDFHEDGTIKNLFLVPYFGACIHFPPPPPNQILFARLASGFADFSLEQAYELKGKISLGLFEDPAGTSAYRINIAEINEYFGEPDDFRQH